MAAGNLDHLKSPTHTVAVAMASDAGWAGVDNDDVKEVRTYLYDMVEMKRDFNIDFASVMDYVRMAQWTKTDILQWANVHGLSNEDASYFLCAATDAEPKPKGKPKSMVISASQGGAQGSMEKSNHKADSMEKSHHKTDSMEKSHHKTDSTALAALEKLKKKQLLNLNNHPDVDPDASTQPLYDDE